jgi:TRAP-type C4-dicarboxylate transport system substrate-binding protein
LLDATGLIEGAAASNLDVFTRKRPECAACRHFAIAYCDQWIRQYGLTGRIAADDHDRALMGCEAAARRAFGRLKTICWEEVMIATRCGTIAGLAGAFAVAMTSLAFAQTAPVTFRASLDTSTTHHRTISVDDYLKKVEAASGGSIKTQLFHSGQLFKDVNVTKALRDGSIEMAVPGIWVLPGFVPDTDLVQLPVLYGQPFDAQLATFDGSVGQKVNAQLEAKLGVKILGPWLNLGFTNYFSTKKPLNSYADLAGLKIRNSGGAGQAVRAKFFNAIPNMTPWPDVPLALAQGTFDALATTNESTASAKLYDSGVKYAFEDHQYLGFYIPMISGVVWAKFTPAQQKLLIDTWAQNIPTYRQNMENAQIAARKELIEHGVKFVVPPPDQVAAMRAKMVTEQDAAAREMKLTPALVKEVTDEISAKTQTH